MDQDYGEVIEQVSAYRGIMRLKFINQSQTLFFKVNSILVN